MHTFNEFMLSRQIDVLAERCVEKNIPVVEFVQYLEAGLLGSMAGGAVRGGGYGSWFGMPGAAVGAGLGALGGAAKHFYNQWQGNKQGQNLEFNKTQAIQAIEKLSKLLPNDAQGQLSQIISTLQGIGAQPQVPQPKQVYNPAMGMAQGLAQGQ